MDKSKVDVLSFLGEYIHDDDSSDIFRVTQIKIRGICNLIRSENFSEEEFLKAIYELFVDEDRLQRLLYSEITDFYMNEDFDSNVLLTNLESVKNKLCEKQNTIDTYPFNSEEEKRDFVKLNIKIYDHFQLVNRQKTLITELNQKTKEAINQVLEHKINDTKTKIDKMGKDIESQLKDVQKEYITILGIFASIVLGFVGSWIFSTSVLTNAISLNRYKLVFTICLIGFISLNMIFYLLKFLMIINNKELNNQYSIRYLNLTLIIVAANTFAAWLISKNFILLNSISEELARFFIESQLARLIIRSIIILVFVVLYNYLLYIIVPYFTRILNKISNSVYK